MLDPKTLEELSQKLITLLPNDVQVLKQDFEKNVGLTLQNVLGRLDLVTREEFDAQREVLARTRVKLEVLEAKVAELEQQK